MEFSVLYAFRQEQLFDYGFGKRYHWDVALYDGYRYEVGPAWVPLRSQFAWRWLIYPAAVIKAFKSDVMIINGFTNLTAFAILLLQPLHRARVLVRNDAAEYGIIRQGFKGWLKRIAYRIVLRSCSRALIQGRENGAFFNYYGVSPERQVFVPVSVLEALFNKTLLGSGERTALREENNASEESCVFVCSGKLEPRKRVDTIIQAFALHRKSAPDSRLWVVGSGREESALRLLVNSLQISREVVFLGFKLQQEMARIYKAADVQVHASVNDPWPVALLEGARCGLPQVIASSVGSCADLVVEGVTGFSFDGSRPETLEKVMTLLARDEALRSRLRAGIIEHTKGYTEEASVEQLACAVLG